MVFIANKFCEEKTEVVKYYFLKAICILIEKLLFIRGCSYGGELVRLGGLTRLSEISPFLRNSYENIMCSYEK